MIDDHYGEPEEDEPICPECSEPIEYGRCIDWDRCGWREDEPTPQQTDNEDQDSGTK
jgi:hypothetical protein